MIDCYMDKMFSIGFKRDKPIAHGRKWFVWTFCFGWLRISKLSDTAIEVLESDEN